MAGDYIITGGRPLNGTVRVPAAKNSVLPLLAASLLCSGPVRLCGVPELADVAESLALLRSAGCTAERQGADVRVDGVPGSGTLAAGPAGRMRASILFCAPLLARLGRAQTVLPGGCTAERQGADVRVDGVPGSGTLAAGPAGRMRASILFCAPLLARLGRAQTVLPGGCRIGARPIDLHLAGLVQMGACPQLEGERLLLTAPAGLHGADITLLFPSVGATETLLLAAALAQGETTLRGAAREPEIEDLAAFLNRCGGRVQGAGTGTVRVQGVRRLHGCSFAPLPDRITAATFACACAAAGGRVELAGCAPRLYAPVLEILEQMGCGVVRRSDAAVITRFGRLYGPGRVFTGAYPALATDAAPLLAAVLLCAEGPGSIEDVIFERRFGCAAGFAALGGRVRVEGRTLYAEPGGTLQGTVLEAPDLRGGAALVIAALAAQGRSRITHTEFIDRGYADFAQKLTALGGQIARETPRGADCPKKRTSKT